MRKYIYIRIFINTCMCICMYIYTHTHTCIYMQSCWVPLLIVYFSWFMRACIHISMNTYTYRITCVYCIHGHTYMYIHVLTHLVRIYNLYVRIYMYNICIYALVYICTHERTHLHVYKYIYTCISQLLYAHVYIQYMFICIYIYSHVKTIYVDTLYKDVHVHTHANAIAHTQPHMCMQLTQTQAHVCVRCSEMDGCKRSESKFPKHCGLQAGR